tara:strand:+ start:194 stop:370 length:177 start_codon:yes stop_codon:yes gene_type:complete
VLSNAAAVSAAVDLKQGTIHVQANAAAAREAIDMPQAPSICHAMLPPCVQPLIRSEGL